MTSSAEDWGAHDLDRRFALGRPHDELTAPRRDARRPALSDRRLASPRAVLRKRDRARAAHSAGRRCGCAPSSRSAPAAPTPTPSAGGPARRGRPERAHGRHDRRAARGRPPGDRPGRRNRRSRGARRASTRTSQLIVPAGLPAAEGDRDVVRRALAPLVDNARRHAPRRDPHRAVGGPGQGAPRGRATMAPASTPSSASASSSRAFGRPAARTAAPVSGSRSRAGWRARAAATSSAAPGPAAASCSSSRRSVRPPRGRRRAARGLAPQSGNRKVRGRILGR